LLLALDAKNHKELNANSVDLSKADFEFYDESSDPHFSDDDNPDVPNLDSWYNYSLSYFILHTGGYKTYALARPEVNKDTFLANYRYTYTYDFLSPNGTTFKMKGVGFKLPNAWIVDAVNLSVPGSHKWNIVSSKLDAGWTYCGKVAQDKNRYGKAVRRKRAGTKFVDTNNSTNDFTPDTIPSLLE
jgi:hypothetical protein